MNMVHPKISSVLDLASKNGKGDPRCGEDERHRRDSRDPTALAVACEEDMLQERQEKEVQLQQSWTVCLKERWFGTFQCGLGAP